MQTCTIIGPHAVPSRYECLDCGKHFTAISFVGGSCTPPFRSWQMPLVACTDCGSRNVRKLGILDTLSDIADWFREL